MMRCTTARMVLALLALGFCVVGTAVASEESAFLQLKDFSITKSAQALESWQVEVDTTPFEQHARVLAVDLFDGQRHLIERYDLEKRGPGDLAWRGRFEDGGQAILTLKHGLVVGVLFAPDGVYELTTSAEGQIFQKLDVEAFPGCANEGESGHAAFFDHDDFGSESARKPVANDDNSVTTKMNVNIDVMTIYTPQARNGAGGTAAIQATAQSAIDVSNTAFTNSDTTPRFTLVHTAEVAYNDTGNIQSDRNWMRSNPTVNALRDTHAADLVGLLVENGGGFCGIAFLMGNEDPAAFAPNGYQVTARNCAVGNLSYPHEHGHNLGLQHDPANGASSSQATYVWSYGHFVNGNYRSVMAYSNQCSQGCTRQPYFSNPDIVFQGAATGIANQRDNARTLDLIAPFTAAYRAAGGGGGGGGGGTCNGSNCIDWDSTGTVSYSTQDNSSSVSVLDGGDTILLQDNTWRRTSQTFNITANTVLEFDFRSANQGEIHGIGFEENDNISDATRIFQLHGTQTWGSANQDFNNYSSGTVTYTIPVGNYYTGNGLFLALVNDNDAGSGNTSYFTNVRVFEGTGGGGGGGGGGGTCSLDDDFESGASGWSTGGNCSTGAFTLGTPSQQTSTVVTQVGGDHTSGSGNAIYTASNSSAGVNDVDGGECVLDSPTWTVSDASTLSVWYFHGQRDNGDDASGDYFELEISTNNGASYSSFVSIGDVQTTAQWTNATANVPAGSNVRLRVRVSDGTSNGDIIEGGIDDLSICPN